MPCSRVFSLARRQRDGGDRVCRVRGQARGKPGPLEVVDVPLVFTQRHILDRRKFRDEARLRGVWLDDSALELLDRHRILTPLFRARRSLKGVRTAIRASESRTSPRYPPWTFVDDAAGLLEDRGRGLLRSGTDSPPVPAGAFFREIEGVSLQVQEALYSPYQLLDIRDAVELLPMLRVRDRSAAGRVRVQAAQRAARAVDRAVLLTALEPRYYPRVVRNLTMPAHLGLEAWHAADRKFDAKALLKWSGWTPAEILEEARRLLFRAWSIDPLRGWVDLVRFVGSSRWKKLRGDALLAIELRIAAEMLLRFHEALHRAKAAPPLPTRQSRVRDDLDDRLKFDPDELDSTLAAYGLSPRPAVLIIAEGQTEMAVLPLVMAELGIKRADSYIKILNAHSESEKHSLLATYAALPKLGPIEQDTAEFLRPPTRYLIAVDGDHTYRTQQARDAERDRLVNRLVQELAPEYDTPAARDDLRSLILIEAWADSLDFERAHFSDRELADAILAVGIPPAGTSTTDVQAELAAQRQSALTGRARGLQAVWRGWPREPSKVALALHLWPTLRTRIRRKRSRAGVDRVPVARVVLLARDLADRSRGNLVMRV